MMLILRPLLLSITLLTGCVSMRTVGVSPADLDTGLAQELTCLTTQSGRAGSLMRGELGGTAVVAIEGLAVGYSRTLDKPEQLGDLTIYATQECMDYDTPLCDHALVVLRGDRAYGLFWQRLYPSRAGMVTTPREVIALHEHDGLFETLALVDLDPPATEALAAMAEARGSRKTLQIAALVAGAAVASVGYMDSGRGLFEAGTLISQLPSSEEQALVRSRPKLLPVLAILTKLSADGSQNAAFCALRN